MPRKRTKADRDTEVKELAQDAIDESVVELEDELALEELESLEEEFSEEEALTSLDAHEVDQMAAAREQVEVEPVASITRDRVESSREVEERQIRSSYDEYGNGDEEDEEEVPEVPEAPPRRETRQEMLGRLMSRLLEDRERVHIALERVRDLNTQLREAGPRPPERLKEAYQKAIAELSRARREENFARAELMQVLNWRG